MQVHDQATAFLSGLNCSFKNPRGVITIIKFHPFKAHRKRGLATSPNHAETFGTSERPKSAPKVYQPCRANITLSRRYRLGS